MPPLFIALDAGQISAWIGVISTIGGTLFAIYKYLKDRDDDIAIRDAFQNVVSDLSSDNPVQRQAAAILLRRFFNPETELGQGKTPYAEEAKNVIAAILRTEKTGELQKLLADGLRHAESLQGADLQRTNLQSAFLGKKSDDDPATDLRKADFFRADLSSASLKGANAEGAVFYQATLHNTTLRGANLSGAYFFEADLLDANFANARLESAQFPGARNVPKDLAKHIAPDGKYTGPTVYEPGAGSGNGREKQVFLSKPGVLSAAQATMVTEISRMLEDEGVGVATLERGSYPGFGAATQVRRVLSGCAGAVILGFRQFEVDRGHWRRGTTESNVYENIALPTSWNHIEAGMATMAGLPMLCINEEGVTGGLFDHEDIDNAAMTVNLERLDLPRIRAKIADWAHAVREAAD